MNVGLFMKNDKNDEKKKAVDNAAVNPEENLPIVSAIVIDEKTGTITLRLASEEEIAKSKEQVTNNN